MDESSPLSCFAEEWAGYLEQHGHRVYRVPFFPDIMTSVNGKEKRFRWFLLCVADESILLTAPHRKELRRQLRIARNFREQCFLVVKFGHPAGKAVVIPTTLAVKLKRLTSETGGIPWEV